MMDREIFYTMFSEIERVEYRIGFTSDEEYSSLLALLRKYYDDICTKTGLRNEECDRIFAGYLENEVDRFNALIWIKKFCLEYCLELVSQFPYGIYSLVNKAVILDSLNNDIALDETMNELEKLFSAKAFDDKRLVWECGSICNKLDRLQEAIEYFKHFIIIVKRDNNWNKNETLYNEVAKACSKIAICYEFNGKYDKAIYIFEYVYGNGTYNANLQIDKEFVSEIEYFIDRIHYDAIEESVKREVMHGLSHFYNECAVFKKTYQCKSTSGSNPCSMCLRKANSLIYELSLKYPFYFSCLSSNHSEYNEFSEAIEILEDSSKFGSLNWDDSDIINPHLKSKSIFYKAHAYMYYEKYIEAKQCLKEFKEYCEKFYDFDGFAYIAIYQAFMLLLENGISEISEDDILYNLNQMQKYIPSLYVNTHMLSERKMLISFLNSYLLILPAIKDRFVSCDLLRNASYSLWTTMQLMKEISGNTLFSLDIPNSTTGSILTQSYLNERFVIFGHVIDTDNNSDRYIEAEAYAFGSLNYPIIINQKVDNELRTILLSLLNRDGVYVIVSTDYQQSFDRYFSGAENVTYCESTNLIHAAYVVSTYSKLRNALLQQKPFLGLSPTKITQAYSFRTRLYKGLFLGGSDRKPVNGLVDVLERADTFYRKSQLVLAQLNNPESEVDFFNKMETSISSQNSDIIGLIYQPMPLNVTLDSQFVWLYKMHGSSIIIPKVPTGKYDFRKRYTDVTKTKKPYCNLIDSLPDDLVIGDENQTIYARADHTLSSHFLKYSSFSDTDIIQWPKILENIYNDLLSNLFYVDFSTDAIRQVVYIQFSQSRRPYNRGYLIVIFDKKLRNAELNKILIGIANIYFSRFASKGLDHVPSPEEDMIIDADIEAAKSEKDKLQTETTRIVQLFKRKLNGAKDDRTAYLEDWKKYKRGLTQSDSGSATVAASYIDQIEALSFDEIEDLLSTDEIAKIDNCEKLDALIIKLTALLEDVVHKISLLKFTV